MCTHVYVSAYVQMCVCEWLYVCVCKCVCVFVYVCVSVCVFVNVCVTWALMNIVHELSLWTISLWTLITLKLVSLRNKQRSEYKLHRYKELMT